MGEHENKKAVGVKIRRAREELGLTQDMLARELGVTTQTVSRWERGVSGPRGPRQKKELATALAAAPTGRTIGPALGVAAALLAGPFGALAGGAVTAALTAVRNPRAAREELAGPAPSSESEEPNQDRELAELRATVARLEKQLAELKGKAEE